MTPDQIKSLAAFMREDHYDGLNAAAAATLANTSRFLEISRKPITLAWPGVSEALGPVIANGIVDDIQWLIANSGSLDASTVNAVVASLNPVITTDTQLLATLANAAQSAYAAGLPFTSNTTRAMLDAIAALRPAGVVAANLAAIKAVGEVRQTDAAKVGITVTTADIAQARLFNAAQDAILEWDGTGTAPVTVI